MAEKDTCEDGINELKKNYAVFQNKYSLPDFDKLNEDFHIEKIAEVETELLLSEIRRFISDKFSNYLKFVESFLNPVNSPMLVFSILKTLGTEEKDKLSEVYKELSKFEIKIIALDLQFNEEKEAEFIKESFKSWQTLKKILLEIVGNVEENWDKKFEETKKGYFG